MTLQEDGQKKKKKITTTNVNYFPNYAQSPRGRARFNNITKENYIF